jgi:hypothetical protein
VISEVSDQNPYGDGIVFCSYENIVPICEHYLAPRMEAERKRVAALGCESLKRVPMAVSIMGAVAELTNAERSAVTSIFDSHFLGATAQLASLRRNMLCPCGSGKRFKHCHGSPTQVSPTSS